jgi:hypothetical protein
MSRSITDFSDCQPSVEKSIFDGMENMIILEHGGDMVYLNPSTGAQIFKVIIENEMKESCIDADYIRALQKFLDKVLEK